MSLQVPTAGLGKQAPGWEASKPRPQWLPEGWSFRHTGDSHYIYTAPDGTKVKSKSQVMAKEDELVSKTATFAPIGTLLSPTAGKGKEASGAEPQLALGSILRGTNAFVLACQSGTRPAPEEAAVFDEACAMHNGAFADPQAAWRSLSKSSLFTNRDLWAQLMAGRMGGCPASVAVLAVMRKYFVGPMHLEKRGRAPTAKGSVQEKQAALEHVNTVNGMFAEASHAVFADASPAASVEDMAEAGQILSGGEDGDSGARSPPFFDDELHGSRYWSLEGSLEVSEPKSGRSAAAAVSPPPKRHRSDILREAMGTFMQEEAETMASGIDLEGVLESSRIGERIRDDISAKVRSAETGQCVKLLVDKAVMDTLKEDGTLKAVRKYIRKTLVSDGVKALVEDSIKETLAQSPVIKKAVSTFALSVLQEKFGG